MKIKIEGVKFKYNFDFDEVHWKGDSERQNLDFPVLYVETSYWGDFTAKPCIMLGEIELTSLPDDEYFTGESEEECKYKTELWIKEQLAPIIKKYKDRRRKKHE